MTPAKHPALDGHRAALRSIARVVGETVPEQDPETASRGLLRMLAEQRPVVITGAGVSTDSGIPDYRGPNGSLHRHRPMTFQEFRDDPAARHRYWARSFVGWRRMDEARPNPAHRILADWVRRGVVSGIVTQNVDGLHAEAGRAAGMDPNLLVELHGDLARVVCLHCGALESRRALDVRLEAANPGFLQRVAVERDAVNPDGDVTLDQRWVDAFRMVGCLACGSVELKPDVVYFGENVPRAWRERADELVDEGRAVLAVGTSLAVMSGFRFVLRAERAGKDVGLVSLGPTRGDTKARWRWRTGAAEALTWLDAHLH
ncbi:Sir2 family NAD-dependent protein deacetylase [Micrococcus sp.]|uniref:Sir2 family NAD-dependent protein deacetylase n=1 Tax=Micrococcus sp. TaxID=1271 RepID=UPI002A90FAEC|nr:Sir2 family NAD-dependent protein deacetylase [Micrococcus sp.]MDY6055269.1 Sir2 family NAD-dependent protein deacetylase [Micrococcus sp.]